jgi:hypothetical protein
MYLLIGHSCTVAETLSISQELCFTSGDNTSNLMRLTPSPAACLRDTSNTMHLNGQLSTPHALQVEVPAVDPRFQGK